MKYKELINKIDELQKKEEKKYKFPSWKGYQRINKIALNLGKKLNADLDVISLGIRLMDLKVGQGFLEKKDHIKMALQIANKLLSDFKEKIGKDFNVVIIDNYNSYEF